MLTASVPLSTSDDSPFLPPPPQRSCNLSPSKLQSCSALCGTAPPTMHGARATCRRQPRTAVELAVLTRHQSTTCTSRRSCEDIMRLPAWHAAAIGELARSMPQLLAIEPAAASRVHARSVGLAAHEAPLVGAQECHNALRGVAALNSRSAVVLPATLLSPSCGGTNDLVGDRSNEESRGEVVVNQSHL